ncbi:GNAT family N-acetyltransferase [Aureimonas populi]|uniref:GNAT family N-acetyltransferase n=1 Tax=Aureimonas populi TaxID=1701758 RepID=A0ABW5CJK0_9HYPH|nr:GNAT family N-acetyltransferase [Aureimonas populi]
MSGAPTIETARLRLRAPTLEDYEAYAAMWREPQVLRYTLREAPGPEQMWVRFLRNPGFWAYLGFGLFTVEERVSGRFAGQVGFFDSRREIDPSLTGEMEVGWTFASRAQGQGYGREATTALFAWAGERFAGRRAVAIIDPGNEVSLKVAARLGFTQVARTTYHGEVVLLLERTL